MFVILFAVLATTVHNAPYQISPMRLIKKKKKKKLGCEVKQFSDTWRPWFAFQRCDQEEIERSVMFALHPDVVLTVQQLARIICLQKTFKIIIMMYRLLLYVVTYRECMFLFHSLHFTVFTVVLSFGCKIWAPEIVSMSSLCRSPNVSRAGTNQCRGLLQKRECKLR